jgi:Phage integrase family
MERVVVEVTVRYSHADDGRLIDDDPKSRAGIRVVSFPDDIVPELADHLERFAAPGTGGLVFIGPKGGRLRRSNFRKFWYRARDAVGMPELHFHDLRHTGNTMAAAEGASPRELMERMGHSSPRAALIYLHATRERDKKIAKGIGKTFREGQERIGHATGTRAWQEGVTLFEKLRLAARAGDGNRTRMTSLEGWGSTIELRPRDLPGAARSKSTGRSSSVAYRLAAPSRTVVDPPRPRPPHFCMPIAQ